MTLPALRLRRQAQLALLILTLTLPACARQSERHPPVLLPAFAEYPVPVPALSAAAATALMDSPYALELDARRSSPVHLLTTRRPLPLKALSALASRPSPGMRGKPLHAELQVAVSITPSRGRPDAARVTIQPEFQVYISGWRDQRQWLLWTSNQTLERELFEGIRSRLGIESAK